MTEPLLEVPPGLKPIPATAHYYYVVDFPGTRYYEYGGWALADHNPLAMVDFGESQAYQNEDGSAWTPTLNHLTERGRMLRAVILDNLPVTGPDRLIVSLTPVVTPEKAFLN